MTSEQLATMATMPELADVTSVEIHPYSDVATISAGRTTMYMIDPSGKVTYIGENPDWHPFS